MGRKQETNSLAGLLFVVLVVDLLNIACICLLTR